MSRTTRHRAVPLLLAVVATLTLSSALVALPGQELNSASAAVTPVTVLAGSDYATTTFRDPWDYSNGADLVLDKGPQLGLERPSMSGGQVHFITHSGYVTPLWGGYANEVPVEREGTRAGNILNASAYTRMNLHIYVSVWTGGALSWHTCGALAKACNGGMNFALLPGWNNIDMPIRRSGATGKPWAGGMVGLRLVLGAPSGKTQVHLDSLRIYKPLSTSAIGWAAPASSPATLWWTDVGGTINAVRSQHAGPVANAATSANSSARVSSNVAGYAPGTRFWSVDANGTKTLVGSTAVPPLPIIDSPTVAGCQNYGGRPWTFTSPRSLAGRANIGAVRFTAAGQLSATNVGPQRNDPSITLPIAPGGIDGRVYHRLTIVESYDGAFNLENRPGGGAHARVLWQSAGRNILAQTAPLVTFTGKRSLTIDMAMPAARLTDPSGPASQRYPFASASRVTRLRYDPNEDPGARRWHLFSVRLAADCQSRHTFAVTWHDTQFRAGNTARVYARHSNGNMYFLGSAAERAGTNRFVAPLRSMPRGKYSVVIYVKTAAGVQTNAVSTGPLVKI